MSRGSLIVALFISMFSASNASAVAIKITNVSRASNFTINTDGTAKIFGGLGGLFVNCYGTQSATSTCNSCTQPDLVCNQKRIHDALILRIDFTVTEDLNAPIWFGYINDGSSPTELPENNITTGYQTGFTGNLVKGTSSYVEVRWGTLCTAGLGQTCDDPTQVSDPTFKLVIGAGTGASPNANSSNEIITALAHPQEASGGDFDEVDCAALTPSTGICKFEAKPGDEKIFVRNLEPIGSYPTSNGIRLIKVRIFYSPTDFQTANYDVSTYVDLDIPNDSVGEPQPDVVEGLENGKRYFFRPAVVDEAYNVAFLIDDAEIAGFTDAGFTGCGSNDDNTCGLIATPDKVFGLLTEDLNCFISTAAFGSTMASEVQTFREFRNQFLVTSASGQKLIKAYYNYGPKMARVIYQHPVLKPVVRVVLYPTLWYSKLSLLLGSPLKATACIGIAFALSLFFGMVGVRRWSLAKH